MTIMSAPISEDRLRILFKYFNRFMVLMWRLGFERYFNGSTFAGYIMVLKHHGRKSGKSYYTPVNFVRMDGDIFCMAGFGEQSDWYLNLQNNPDVEVWLPDGRWSGTAEVLAGAENQLLILRQLIIASGFAAPAFGLHLDHVRARPGETAGIIPLGTHPAKCRPDRSRRSGRPGLGLALHHPGSAAAAGLPPPGQVICQV